MSWFGDTFGNIGAGIGLVGGGLVGATIGGTLVKNKNDANNSIDSQIAANNADKFGPSTPGYIDTSKFPQTAQQFGSPSSSPWLAFQDNKIGSQVAGAQDQASQQAGASAAQGLSAVASHGGMTSGAAERSVTNANNQGFQAGQEASRAGITASANAGAQNADIWGKLAAQDNQNQVSGQIANSQLAGAMYGANQSANAQLQASKKTGLFGLGIGGIL